MGGVEDHLHLAVGLSRTVSIAEFVKRIKQSSSVWMKDQSGVSSNFEWQAGYGAFSLGQSQLEGLVKYIESQQEHHRVRSFQDEYRDLLTKYGINPDERYLWD